MQTRIAADDVRKLSLPQKAEDYKVELPASFKAPEGLDFKFKDGDPLLAQAQSWAHKNGLSQDAFKEVLGLYAGAQVATQHEITAARAAEVAKLGPAGPARVTAVTTFLKSFVGETEGAQIAARMFTASDVANFEKLITKVSTQGGGSFRANGREPPEATGGKIPGYENMTFMQKRAAQDQLRQKQN